MENANDQLGYPDPDTFHTFIPGNFILQDVLFPSGHVILEAGCENANQIKSLASRNPGCLFFSWYKHKAPLTVAQKAIVDSGLENVKLLQSNIYQLPFPDGCFDHVVLYLVLEQLVDPKLVLREFVRVLKPGGTIVAVAGDFGSVCYSPESKEAAKLLDGYVSMQFNAGKNPNIGRTLAPALRELGLTGIHIQTEPIYADSGEPDLAHGFVQETFIRMLELQESELVDGTWIDSTTFRKGIDDLYLTTGFNGVFTYAFYTCRGVKFKL